MGGFFVEFELFWRTRGRLDTFTGRGDGVGLLRRRRDASEARDMRSRRADGVPRHRCSAQVGNSVKRLAGGLSKLVDAARDVDRMSIELKDAQVIVSAKTVEVEALIEQITEKTTIANKRARGVPSRRGRFLFC